MAIFKCKMCGGDLEVTDRSTVVECPYCLTSQTVSATIDEKRINLFNRANRLRMSSEFDKAGAIYEQIIAEFPEEAEAYWGLCLCNYGIEYVDDPATAKKVPTVHRASIDKMRKDENYALALEYADLGARIVYEDGAKEIDRIMSEILAVSKNEQPYDIFICYKESDRNGDRTPDSVLAQDIYDALTAKNYRVFFARITLEDKLGVHYEPYIFSALHSAKIMLVVGTDYDYMNAVWVKNEWSRFIKLMAKDKSKVLIPCYKDMDPYDMPDEFKPFQAQDCAKLGFMQDLTRGIDKIFGRNDAAKTVVTNNSPAQAPTAPLLERAFMFLEDGKWQDADIYCEKVLDIDPKNAEAYLGKLMVELQVRNRKQLADCAEPFDDRDNYSKVLRFGDEALEKEMRGYITHINDRNENARLTGIYNNAKNAMNAANTEAAFKAAADTFATIPGFKDADTLAEKCLDKAEVCRKDAIYASAKTSMTGEKIAAYETAIKTFRTISGWKDADEQIYACQKKIEEIKAKEEADRLEAERKAEERRIAAEKAAKKLKKAFAIGTPIVAACIAFVFVLTTVIIPNNKYNSAVALMNNKKYDEAISAFEALNGYKDSADKISACQTALKDIDYNAAIKLMDDEKYAEAIKAFEALNGYEDSAKQIENCNTAIMDQKYDAAAALMKEGKYAEAIKAFEALNGYKDSAKQIENCNTAIMDQKYDAAAALMKEGKYAEAIKAFEALNGYKDSAEQIKKCHAEPLKNTKVGDTVVFGAYEQDNNTSNGKEAIKWKVLAKEGTKILVTSEYALDCKPYNTSYISVTWETCTLRKWLNNEFYNAAFSASEKLMIAQTTVSADKNPIYSTDPGKATSDKVFLLSIAEVNKYMTTDAARQCASTAYAKAQGAFTSSSYGKPACCWWLRSPGQYQPYAAYVYYSGTDFSDGNIVNYGFNCVRPALWIDLE